MTSLIIAVFALIVLFLLYLKLRQAFGNKGASWNIYKRACNIAHYTTVTQGNLSVTHKMFGVNYSEIDVVEIRIDGTLVFKASLSGPILNPLKVDVFQNGPWVKQL